MKHLESYLGGKWQKGSGKETELTDASTGETVAITASEGYDFASALAYGRQIGGKALRNMTFHERGRMLKALAFYLLDRKEDYYTLSYATGATRTDSWIDIEGGIGTLFAYSSLRKQFPNQKFYVDGDAAQLSKRGTFIGQHIMVPRKGIAIHINAFNFPVWGMLEKISVNLLAGVPALVKPATLTAYLTERVVRDIIASGILPEGSLQLLCGSAGDLLNHVTEQDVVTFTGSASTGKKLRSHPQLIAHSVPFTMEADSLNAAVLGTDAAPGTPEFDLFIKEIRREMTAKCGQKCTAIRRIIVPEKYLEDVQISLAQALSKTVIGNPRSEKVRMGALAGMAQLQEVKERLAELQQDAEIVYGHPSQLEPVDAEPGKGAFMPPILLRAKQMENESHVHNTEVFGPVATLLPYNSIEEAVELTQRGKGSLVCTYAGFNRAEAEHFVLEAASHHGRIQVLDRECAAESTGHGSPMPLLVHGGPGRAGGGEEMGGKRGVLHYLQRCAVQGSPTAITHVSKVYQQNAQYRETDVHVFRKHFEDLQVGDTVVTHKHTVTEADIVNFANLSGDNFYAHMDATSLEGTIFERRVAHGYFVLSKAAGLFVDPKKGPVLLNYGLEDCRFTKPVYPGMTIGVRLTVKEKVDQEKRSEDDIAKGIVKFFVDVYDETGETVALATILTMVKKKNQLN